MRENKCPGTPLTREAEVVSGTRAKRGVLGSVAKKNGQGCESDAVSEND